MALRRRRLSPLPFGAVTASLDSRTSWDVGWSSPLRGQRAEQCPALQELVVLGLKPHAGDPSVDHPKDGDTCLSSTFADYRAVPTVPIRNQRIDRRPAGANTGLRDLTQSASLLNELDGNDVRRGGDPHRAQVEEHLERPGRGPELEDVLIVPRDTRHAQAARR